MKEVHLLNKYEGMSLYEYRKTRKEEKGPKIRVPVNEKIYSARDEVWGALLKGDQDITVFQQYHYWSYQPKPNPRDLDANEAGILVLESQRRFLQTIDHSIVPGQDVMHMDLSSAYLTALANVKHSLKFNAKYPLNTIGKLHRNMDNAPIHWYVVEDKFNIVKVRLEMPYDNKINIFAPNNKIRYNGKEVSNHNQPMNGDLVQVRLELFINSFYNIDSWDSWTTIFKDYDINYLKIDVFTYDLIDRKQMFDLSEVKTLLEGISKKDKEDKVYYKQAIVSFTGQLMNIDPGRRLIMLASAEEVMRRLYIDLSRDTTVYGLQIDGIYYEPYDYPVYENPLDRVYEIGRLVYRIPSGIGYNRDLFSKVELWGPDKYSIKPFRIQEVR